MIVLLVAGVSSCDQCTGTAEIQIQRVPSQIQRLAVQYPYGCGPTSADSVRGSPQPKKIVKIKGKKNGS
jgi:hypothetical protein